MGPQFAAAEIQGQRADLADRGRCHTPGPPKYRVDPSHELPWAEWLGDIIVGPRELVARVRAVLRRTHGDREAPPPPIIAAGVTIDLERRRVLIDGREVDLTPTEFDLLVVLARHPGRVFSRLELLDRVQGYAFEGYERTVDAHVKNLRQKIEPDPKNPRYIETVYGVGYRFAE